MARLGRGYPIRPHILYSARSAYAAAVLADVPLAAWTQDHDPGYTDYTGNGHDLSSVGTVTYGGADPGVLTNTSSSFPGTAGSETPGVGTWAGGLSTFSVECWFKASAVATNGSVLMALDNADFGPSDSRRVWNLTLQTGGNARFECYNTSGGVGSAISSGTNYANGVWHHAVATYNAGAILLYIDGAQVATGTQTGTLNSGGTSPFSLASCNAFSTFADSRVSLNGSMCFSAVYPTALSAARVLVHYSTAMGSVTRSGTAAVTLGALTVSSAGTRTHSTTATAPLGGMTVTATGTRTRPAAATMPLGALTVTAAGTRTHFTTATFPLGTLTVAATSTAHSTINGTAAAPLGALVVTSRAAIVGRGTVTLGSLTVTSAGFRRRSGTASLPLGSLAVTGAGTVRHPGTASVPLGSLTVASSGGVVHVVSGTAAMLLGSVAVTAIGHTLHLPPTTTSVVSGGATAITVTAHQGGITYTSVVTSGSTTVLIQPQGRQLGQVLIDGRTDITINRNAGQRTSVVSSGVTRVLLIYKPAPDGPVLSADISNNTPIGVGVDLTGFYVANSEGA